MTAPQDPFRAPDPADRPAGSPPAWQPYGQSGQDSAPAQYGQAPYGQSGYGQAGYAQQPYGSPPPGSPSNGMGVAALVLGIVGLFTWFFLLGGLLGIVAVILGVLARKKASRGEATNGGIALGGIITGAISVVLAVVVGIFFAALFSRADVGNLTDCLREANGDQARIDQCQRDFEADLRS